MHHTHRSLPTLAPLTACALALSACGSTEESATVSSPAMSTVTSTADAMPSTVAATANTGQEKAAAPRSAAAGISPLGKANTDMKTLRPEAPSQLMVKSVRIGQHEGFERVVFDVEGSGTPGWFIDYTDHPAQQGSGNPIEFEGATALNVNIDGMVYPFEMGKEDPNLGTVRGSGGIVTEVTSAGTFEGRSQFVIGLDAKHPYSVQVLKSPTRLVIDILAQ